MQQVGADVVARVYPRANARFVADLQRIHDELDAAMGRSRSRGVGASLVVAQYAVRAAIMFALHPDVLARNPQMYDDVTAAWAMLMGEGTERTIEVVHGTGSAAAMVQKLVDGFANTYATFEAANNTAMTGAVLGRARTVLSWLLPMPPSLALVREALVGTTERGLHRDPMNVLADLLVEGGKAPQVREEGNEANAVKVALGKHKRTVRRRYPPST